MFNNIAFIGGIHGVGKSTICREICGALNLELLSASNLLKWKEINADSKNKKVSSIPDTQDRLLVGLTNTVQKDKRYLLDGHYCLLNVANEIVNVPLDTFKSFDPISLCIILGDIDEIRNRLELRDGKPYSADLLNKMQNRELDYANYLSKTLCLNLCISSQSDYSNLLALLRESFTTK